MSLVGTRPPTVDEWDKYELHHRARLATKPGLTGMWQVSGRSNITDLTYNTVGGAVGGVIYYLGYCRKGKRKNKKQRIAIGALGDSRESSVLSVRRLDSHGNRS